MSEKPAAERLLDVFLLEQPLFKFSNKKYMRKGKAVKTDNMAPI